MACNEVRSVSYSILIPAVQEMKFSEKPTGTFCPELFNCETVLHFEPRHQNFLGVHSLRGLHFSYANGCAFFSLKCVERLLMLIRVEDVIEINQ